MIVISQNQVHIGIKTIVIHASRQWRTGQELPRQFSSSRYEVNHNELRRLPKVGRNQQWLKINGDYVLVNERNDRILRIIG